MKNLWAPWRKKYIFHPDVKGCIFCDKPKQKGAAADARNFVLERGRSAFALLNLYPYNNGHFMVAPYRHIGSPTDLTEKEALEIFGMAKRWMLKCDRALKPHGYNLGMNIGKVAGAGFDAHIHLHVVPRWRGDTNFMPVVSGHKVVSQSLTQLRKSLLSMK